jgi:hypothetical protein
MPFPSCVTGSKAPRQPLRGIPRGGPIHAVRPVRRRSALALGNLATAIGEAAVERFMSAPGRKEYPLGALVQMARHRAQDSVFILKVSQPRLELLYLGPKEPENPGQRRRGPPGTTQPAREGRSMRRRCRPRQRARTGLGPFNARASRPASCARSHRPSVRCHPRGTRPSAAPR